MKLDIDFNKVGTTKFEVDTICFKETMLEGLIEDISLFCEEDYSIPKDAVAFLPNTSICAKDITNDGKYAITYIEDIIFGILTGIFLIFMLFIFSNGQLRLYIFLAITLGLILYFITISKYFIKINVKILKILKKIIISIISVFIYPFKKISKLLSRVILKPFRILIINIKNTNFKKIKIHKLKKDKKMQNEKRILWNNVE